MGNPHWRSVWQVPPVSANSLPAHRPSHSVFQLQLALVVASLFGPTQCFCEHPGQTHFWMYPEVAPDAGQSVST